MKQDLKVIILKGFVLLPNNELKVDLNISQSVLDTSEFFNDNKILFMNFDSLEETINFNNLPKIDTIILSIPWRNSYIWYDSLLL